MNIQPAANNSCIFKINKFKNIKTLCRNEGDIGQLGQCIELNTDKKGLCSGYNVPSALRNLQRSVLSYRELGILDTNY